MYYNKFSDYLKNKYGSKVYKIPVNLPVSCPNQKAETGGYRGCIFCGSEGAGFELLSNELSITKQVEDNVLYISKKYNVNKFIIYFQNYSNTYMSVKDFDAVINETIEIARKFDVVALYISTRPDCINEKYMEILKRLEVVGIDVCIELGLQTVNYKTLKILKRGHSLAEFIDAVKIIKRFGFDIVAHLILDLPFDDYEDVIETAKIISSLEIEQVKCHSLYVLDNTTLGEMYKAGTFIPLTIDEFINRTVLFLEYLSPRIIVQRLIGRAPKERTLFCNFGVSWWKIHDMIIAEQDRRDSFQGKYFNYLNGKALKFSE